MRIPILRTQFNLSSNLTLQKIVQVYHRTFIIFTTCKIPKITILSPLFLSLSYRTRTFTFKINPSFLNNCYQVYTGYNCKVVYLGIEGKFYFALWAFGLQIPDVQMPSFIGSYPCIKVLEEPDTALILLAMRGRRNRFFELEIVTLVPEVDREIFQHCSNPLLSLTISKRQHNNIFFQLGKMWFNFLHKPT